LDVDKLAIPHDALIFVGAGRKALFLRNAGDEKFPNLKTERVFAEENPPTHEQGTDRYQRELAQTEGQVESVSKERALGHSNLVIAAYSFPANAKATTQPLIPQVGRLAGSNCRSTRSH
jgi:protein required for attachment to host cells